MVIIEGERGEFLVWCLSVARLAFVSAMPKLRTIRRLRALVHPYGVFPLVLLLLLVGFRGLLGICEGADVVIGDFYACDTFGVPLDYFPKLTTAYFNINVTNLSQAPVEISLYLSVLDELDVPIGSDELAATAPVNSSAYVLSIYIPKWAFVGVATAHLTMLVEGTAVDSKITELHIGPVDLTPPVIHIVSPENMTYEADSVPLVFTVDERTLSMSYSLNNLSNVSIAENTSLTRLADGPYNLIVYANDTSGNMGSSEVCFTIAAIHDLAVVDLRCYPAKTYVGQPVNITTIVENEGTATETFVVAIYANLTVIETMNVTDLSPATEATLDTIWNTTDSVKGNYTIKTQIEPIHGETDIEDNAFVYIVRLISRPDIAVTEIASSKTRVGQGFPAWISVTVRNEGDYTETFNVTAYTNTIPIVTIDEITLTSKNSTTLLLIWNTTTFAMTDYSLSAYAWPLPNETNTVNNRLVGGTVHVGIPGDIAPVYGLVDMKDVGMVLKAFSSIPSQPAWNPNADINGDEKVDMNDVGIVTRHFGESIL